MFRRKCLYLLKVTWQFYHKGQQFSFQKNSTVILNTEVPNQGTLVITLFT